MARSTRIGVALGVVVSLLLLVPQTARAQVVTLYPPAVTYYSAPVVSYYSAPVYTPAPVASYYAPAVSYYTPAVSYYAPAVSYYAPAVSYYPAPTAVITARYGPFGRLRYTSTRYYP